MPPIELSICASSVVGACTSLIPRRYVAAAKPAASPAAPPPRAIKASLLETECDASASYIRSMTLKRFAYSPQGTSTRNASIPFELRADDTLSKKSAPTFSSQTMPTCRGSGSKALLISEPILPSRPPAINTSYGEEAFTCTVLQSII